MSTDTFDYVVVGGGSAGCVLAHRLSAGGATVCVLEAGPTDSHLFVTMPGGFIKVLADHALTWRFESEPGPGTGGRRISATQGRMLGGSSSINGLLFVRGQSADYDEWREKGNVGWGYADVLPYFKRLEDRAGDADETYRGRGGPLPVTSADWKHPLCDAFIAGAIGVGYPRNPDYNGASQGGVDYYQRMIVRTRRINAARAFLDPALKSGRVTVRTNSQATAVALEGTRAVGVRYSVGGNGGDLRTVRANREVIVACGTINSPKLLQLSGIGPASLLRDLGIEVRREIAGVGENLRDHYSPRIVARAKNTATINELVRGPRLLGELAKWALRRPGVLGSSAALVGAFGKSDPALPAPDYTIIFTPASYRAGFFGQLDLFPGMTCGAWQMRPESSGYVRIRSTNAADAPIIQPNYLAAEKDRQVLLAAVRGARKILASPEMAPYYDREEQPGSSAVTDDELLDFARRYGTSSYHLMGTCRMGPADDPSAVVDTELRVRGIDRLRVVDASVMPMMTSANTYATALMIAEKAADLILGRPALAPVQLPGVRNARGH